MHEEFQCAPVREREEEEEEEEEEECFFLTAGCTVHLFPYQTIILLSLPFEGGGMTNQGTR